MESIDEGYVSIYRKRRTVRITVACAPHDVVSSSLSLPVPNSAAEKFVSDGDDDEKSKGFADSTNKSEITEAMLLHGDDDDGGGFNDEKVEGFADFTNKRRVQKPVEPVEHNTTELHQQDVEHSDTKKLKSIQELYAKTKPILHHSQPSQMSTSSTEPEEMTKVADSDGEEGITPKNPSRNHTKPCRRSNRKRQSKALVDSDPEFTVPHLQLRGQPKATVDSSNSVALEGITKYPSQNQINACRRSTRRRSRRIIDVSDSELTMPSFQDRGQPKGPECHSNSFTTEGVLNSRLFPCYMEQIWNRVSEEKRNSFTHMDCLWFCSYTECLRKEKVLEWIKRRNIFSRKYVLVPIVIWSHWNLLIFCHFGESQQSKIRTPCMLLLDSLQTTSPNRLEPLIRKFVMDIYIKEERPETEEMISKIPLLIPSVPQQIDDKKCGYFVLYFIHLFIENAPENFSIYHGYPYFMKEDWFTLEGLDNFCRTLESENVKTSSSDE